jgi:ribosomal protein S18 acetylase RimI-like enzyme
MTSPDVVVRRATEHDLETIGELGAMLVRGHYELDPQRFLSPGPHSAKHYGSFLGSQLRRRDAAVFVAERAGRSVGYLYVELEPRNWMELRDEAGFIHDVVVAPEERRGGVATRLLAAATEWLESKGAPRVVLWTAEQNTGAQRFFERAGFRRTMIEMTRELHEGAPDRA